MKDHLSADEIRYNAESLQTDSLWEFHPDAFEFLSAAERKALFRYYPQDLDSIPNVFAYRRELALVDPEAAKSGRESLRRVVESLGMRLDDIY